MFHPPIFLTLAPGKATTKRIDETSQTNAARNPLPIDETPDAPEKTAKGDNAVRSPNPAIDPKIPSTPKISASHGVMVTINSFTLAGRDGTLLYQPSSVAITIFHLLSCQSIYIIQ